MNYDELEPGRDLDALVAEKVMGIDLTGERPDLPIRGIGCAPYSTSIAAAWKVVEKVRLTVWPTNKARWYVFQDEFNEGYGEEYWFGGGAWPHSDDTVNEDVCLAICIAALKATEKQQ